MQPPQFLVASHGNEPAVQFRPQTQMLESIMDEHRQFGLVAAVQFAHSTYPDDLGRPTCILVFTQQHHFPVVIGEADSAQPLMGCPLT